MADLGRGVSRLVCGEVCTADDHDPGDTWVCALPPDHADYIDHGAVVPGGWHTWPNVDSRNVDVPEERIMRQSPGGLTEDARARTIYQVVRTREPNDARDVDLAVGSCGGEVVSRWEVLER
jgi:hypothetical protein